MGESQGFLHEMSSSSRKRKRDFLDAFYSRVDREGFNVLDAIEGIIVDVASEFPEEFMRGKSRLAETLRSCGTSRNHQSSTADLGLQEEKDVDVLIKEDGSGHGFTTEDEAVSGLQTMSSSDDINICSINKRKIPRIRVTFGKSCVFQNPKTQEQGAIVAVASEFPKEFMLRKSQLEETVRSCGTTNRNHVLQGEKDANVLNKEDGSGHGFTTEDEAVSGLLQNMSNSDDVNSCSINKRKIPRIRVTFGKSYDFQNLKTQEDVGEIPFFPLFYVCIDEYIDIVL